MAVDYAKSIAGRGIRANRSRYANERVRIAATGRALADLRLWRDGRDLVDMAAAASLVM